MSFWQLHIYMSIQEKDFFFCILVHSYKSVCVQITVVEITITLFFYWELRACIYFNTSQKNFHQYGTNPKYIKYELKSLILLSLFEHLAMKMSIK